MMKTLYEIYDLLQKKKDTGQSMSGHERMELHYVTEIIILKDQLKEAVKALEFYEDGHNYEAHESQSYVVWEAKEDFSGARAYKALEYIKGLNKKE